MLLNKTHGENFDEQSEMLIFPHIPKSAGTSMHGVLGAHFGKRYRHFTSKAQDRENLEGICAGGGHQPYGQSVLHKRSKALRYVSVIRNPFDRLYSYHSHILRHGEHHWHQELMRNTDGSFEDGLHFLLKKGDPQLRNFSCQMLAPEIEPSVKNADEIYDFICESFVLVGIVDEMEDFYQALAGYLNIAQGDMLWLNMASKPMQSEGRKISPHAADVITEFNALDLEIYWRFAGMNQLVALT